MTTHKRPEDEDDIPPEPPPHKEHPKAKAGAREVGEIGGGGEALPGGEDQPIGAKPNATGPWGRDHTWYVEQGLTGSRI